MLPRQKGCPIGVADNRQQGFVYPRRKASRATATVSLNDARDIQGEFASWCATSYEDQATERHVRYIGGQHSSESEWSGGFRSGADGKCALAERAARLEAHSRPRASRFRTAQYPAPPEPSSPQATASSAPVVGQESTAADPQRSEVAAKAALPGIRGGVVDQPSSGQDAAQPQQPLAAKQGNANRPQVKRDDLDNSRDSRAANEKEPGQATSPAMSTAAKPSVAIPNAAKDTRC